MNQEYVLLCGLLWRLMGKRVYLWRNHHSGNMLTRVAVLFCHKAFCTSRYSYTAQFKKTCFMPVGIDMDLFKPSLSAGPQPSTTASRILFLGRVAPVKRPDVFVDALELLVKKSSADIYGDALPKDQVYLDGLKKRVSESAALSSRVSFFAGIPNAETVVVYQQHGVYVNLSSSGMYDKTIFEAMACGSLVLASNKNLEGVIDGRCVLGESEVNAEGVATKLEVLLALSEQERSNIVRRLVAVAGENSLQALVSRLFEEMGK